MTPYVELTILQITSKTGHSVELTNGQVALAALLIVINGVVSVALRLRMEKTLVIASLRTVIQLTLLGLVLSWVFRVDRWYVVAGIASVMTLVAGGAAAGRSKRTFPGIRSTRFRCWAWCWATRSMESPSGSAR